MKKIVFLGVMTVLLGGGAYMTFFRSPDKTADESGRALVVRRQISDAAKVGARRRPAALSPKKRTTQGVSLPSAPVMVRRPPEMMGVGLREEKEMTELARAVLRELQCAIDTKDLKSLRALVARMYAEPQAVLGMEAVPPAFRRKLVQAFSWFGPEGAVDLMQFLADDDPTVVDMTRDAYVMSAMDFTVSDRERADYILAALQTLTDERTVSMLMPAIQSMRHSVGVATLLQIAVSGSEVAQAKVPDAVRAFTQNADIQTTEELSAWLAEHPDGAMDEQFYGGWKAMSEGFGGVRNN